MQCKQPEYKPEFQESRYRLRRAGGILGNLLPFIILPCNSKVLNSISHYYYTNGSVFFIAILSTFGTLLITYKGYKNDSNVIWNDNVITNLAGFSILITVLIPTGCCGSGDKLIYCCKNYLFGHTDFIMSIIHLTSAGVFLFLLGIMCYKQFTKNNNKVLRNKIYKTCALIIWTCIAIITSSKILEHLDLFYLKNYLPAYVYVFESIAVLSFGTAWLKKGKADLCIKEKYTYTKKYFE